MVKFIDFQMQCLCLKTNYLNKGMPMSAEIIEATKEEETVDVQKRAFMSKFGKYAAAGAGMAVLMTPTLSSANTYPADDNWVGADTNINGKTDTCIQYDLGTLSYEECIASLGE